MRRAMLAMLATLTIGAATLLSGCEKAPPPPAPVKALVALKAGQWTLTRDMTGYNTPTVTREIYAAKVEQDKPVVADICLKVDAQGRPDPGPLAGDEGTDCTYKDAHVDDGRLVATLACKAGDGTSELVLEGNYTADSMTMGLSMTKTVGDKPVLRTTHDLTGKRSGECKG